MRANSASLRAIPPPWPPSVNAGPHDERQADVAQRRAGLLGEVAMRLRGTRRPALEHRLAEQVAVLGPADRVVVGADQLDAELVQVAVLVQGLGQVERRLAAERRQQRVRALLLDDPRDRAGSIGSMYVAVANSGSVMIVAGLELTSTTS